MTSELDTFYKSGLHGEEWPNQVLALYESSRRSDSARITVYSNDRETRQHAEELLLDSLQRHVCGLPTGCLHITVYQNYSPCSTCSQRYLNAIDRLENSGFTLKLTIVFVAFYKIARPSCKDRKCTTHKMPLAHQEREHLQGLQKLMKKGVDLRSFQGCEDWLALRKLLGLSNLPYNITSRYEEDRLMQDDVRQKLHGTWYLEPSLQNGRDEVQRPTTGYPELSLQNGRVEAQRTSKDTVINMPPTKVKRSKSLCERLCTIL